MYCSLIVCSFVWWTVKPVVVSECEPLCFHWCRYLIHFVSLFAVTGISLLLVMCEKFLSLSMDLFSVRNCYKDKKVAEFCDFVDLCCIWVVLQFSASDCLGSRICSAQRERLIIIIIIIIRQFILRRNMSVESLQGRRTTYATRIKLMKLKVQNTTVKTNESWADSWKYRELVQIEYRWAGCSTPQDQRWRMPGCQAPLHDNFSPFPLIDNIWPLMVVWR